MALASFSGHRGRFFCVLTVPVVLLSGNSSDQSEWE